MKCVISGLKRIRAGLRAKLPTRGGSAAYWTRHMVAMDDWSDSNSSTEHFLWRNAQYPGYIDLMPVSFADGLVVVDYGCGPGNDLVGFSEFSKPDKLIGIDVSPTALATSKKRLALHGKSADLIQIEENRNQIPLESGSVDLVHSSGVLHHAENPGAALSEIYRILKPGGKFQVMVYNYDSLWMHLYVAYVLRIEIGKHDRMPLLDAFRKTTDGPNCPISHCYRPAEFLELVQNYGFQGRFKGAAISLFELELLPKRYAAINSRALPREHREFISRICFNHAGHPIVNDAVAGVDACFEFRKP
jgi:ubiquinone/menaquinone biosynthesis C-methylase UbiE